MNVSPAKMKGVKEQNVLQKPAHTLTVGSPLEPKEASALATLVHLANVIKFYKAVFPRG